MKKSTTLFLLLLAAAAAFSQNDSLALRRQFGFDAAGFFDRYLIFGSGGGATSTPFYLSFKKMKDGKITRMGLGADLSVKESGTTGVNSTHRVHFRVGGERFHDFGKRWRAFYGTDFRLLFGFTGIGNTGNNATQVFLGPAPLFGLQFRLNERLSLATETAYQVFLSLEDSGGNTRLGFLTSFSPPVALYVNYDY